MPNANNTNKRRVDHVPYVFSINFFVCPFCFKFQFYSKKKSILFILVERSISMTLCRYSFLPQIVKEKEKFVTDHQILSVANVYFFFFLFPSLLDIIRNSQFKSLSTALSCHDRARSSQSKYRCSNICIKNLACCSQNRSKHSLALRLWLMNEYDGMKEKKEHASLYTITL